MPDLKLAKGISCAAEVIAECVDDSHGNYTTMIDNVSVSLMGLQIRDIAMTDLVRLNVNEDNKLFIEPLQQI